MFIFYFVFLDSELGFEEYDSIDRDLLFRMGIKNLKTLIRVENILKKCKAPSTSLTPSSSADSVKFTIH